MPVATDSSADTARRGAGHKNTSNTGGNTMPAAPRTTTTRASRSVKTPLSDVEFDSASDIIKYGDVMRRVGRTEQLELHTAADELQAVLTHSTGNVFERAAARRKAKKIANHLRAAADHARAIAVEGVRLQRGFKREYADLLDPPKKPRGKTLDWKG